MDHKELLRLTKSVLVLLSVFEILFSLFMTLTVAFFYIGAKSEFDLKDLGVSILASAIFITSSGLLLRALKEGKGKFRFAYLFKIFVYFVFFFVTLFPPFDLGIFFDVICGNWVVMYFVLGIGALFLHGGLTRGKGRVQN